MEENANCKQQPLMFLPARQKYQEDEHQRSADVSQLRKPSDRAVFDSIDSEINSLVTIQASNNDEIKKRMTEIQSLRESNLVVVGAIRGLKKIKEKHF